MATPIAKWCGGKTRLLPELHRRLPPAYGRYYEPFAGGAALFFSLADALRVPRVTVARPITVTANAVLGDFNVDLATMYWAVRADVESVINILKTHAAAHATDEDYYYKVRDLWNRARTWTPTQRAAAFIYLNKTCFNGLWRVNASGGFNVPKGKYTNPTICDEDALRAAARALKVAEIRCGSYEKLIEDVRAGDFIYFDPPYDETFNGYTTEGTFDQVALAALVRHLVKHGVQVMLSNSDTPLVRELYAGSDFQIDTVRCVRAINSDTTGRGAVNEVIVTGGYVPEIDRATEARASHRG